MTTAADYVFLHGGGQAGWVWDETIAALTQQTAGEFGRALALDAPGCGKKRGRDTASMTIDAVVNELIADITAHGMQDIILVGHSQAGTVLPRLVEKQSALFRRVVYVSCIAPTPGKTIIQQMGSSLHGAHPDEVGWPVDPRTVTADERYAMMFCNDMSKTEAANFVARLGHDHWPAHTMAAADWRYDHLSGIQSTYVVCRRDGILPAAWQERFASRLKAQRSVWIDAGHQVMNSRPHALAEVLRYETD